MDNASDLALLILRVAFGVACVAHGWPKIRAVDKFAGAHRLPPPVAWLAALTQFVGGILVILGTYVQPAAWMLVGFGLFATYVLIVRKEEPFAAPDVHCWDAGLLYTAIPLTLALAGPGRFTLF